ncbi:Hydroxysteroid 11-beta-dehydrogenase 1-like protein [Armadillidium vulgare]|nr:Hydroxysteroid 11-beta-dehydrogenase 1-like protein [Armadillidium vulgare]
MEKWKGRVAVVTGANSHFGSAICEKLLNIGMVVIGTHKSGPRYLERVTKKLEGKGIFLPMKCDITKNEIKNFFFTIRKKFGGVDVCINNDGYIPVGLNVMDGSITDWRKMFEVNVIGASLFMQLTVKSIRERKLDEGHIINISCLAGRCIYDVGVIHFYTAAKLALNTLSKGLRQTLREAKSGIKVSVGVFDKEINPWIIQTDSFTPIPTNINRYDPPNLLREAEPAFRPEDVAHTVTQILATPSHDEVSSSSSNKL